MSLPLGGALRKKLCGEVGGLLLGGSLVILSLCEVDRKFVCTSRIPTRRQSLALSPLCTACRRTTAMRLIALPLVVYLSGDLLPSHLLSASRRDRLLLHRAINHTAVLVSKFLKILLQVSHSRSYTVHPNLAIPHLLRRRPTQSDDCTFTRRIRRILRKPYNPHRSTPR